MKGFMGFFSIVYTDVLGGAASYFERNDQLIFWLLIALSAVFLIAIGVSWAIQSHNDNGYFRRMNSEVNSVRIYRIENGKDKVTFFDLGALSEQRTLTLREFYSSFPGNDPQRVKSWIEDILAERKTPDYLQVSVYFHRSKMRLNTFLHVRKKDPLRGVIHLESYLLAQRKSKTAIGSFVKISSERDFAEALRVSGGDGVTYCFNLGVIGAKGNRKKEKVSQSVSYHFRMALEPFVKNGSQLIQASESELLIANFEQTDNAEAIGFALNAVSAIRKDLQVFASNKKPLDVRVGIVYNKDLMGDGDAIISSARRTARDAFESSSVVTFFKRGTEDYSQSELVQYRSEVERIIYEKRLLYSFRPVYSVARRRIIGYLGKTVPASDCAFDSIDELKNYALRAKDDKNLFAAIAKNLVGIYNAERELKSQKLYYPTRPNELPMIPSFFKRLRGAKEANLVFLLDSYDIGTALSHNGIDPLIEGIEAVKEAGYGIAFVLRGKTLTVESRLLAYGDAFFVDFSSSEDDAGLDTAIRSQLHALVEKLLKYKKPIVATNLTNWNALELVVGSGIDTISSDVFTPYAPSLTPIIDKNETRILALKGKI